MITDPMARLTVCSFLEDGLTGEGVDAKQRALQGIVHALGYRTGEYYEQIPEPENALDALLREALICDEAHHKQWYLERILQMTGLTVIYPYEHGIAP